MPSAPFGVAVGLVIGCLLQAADAGEVGGYTGGGRQRSYGTVRDPAAGFFVGGSSLEDMDGVYSRISPEEAPEIGHQWEFLYRNDEGGWIIGLAKADPATAIEGKRSEWLLVDGSGFDRFGHPGETVIPGAGERWAHLHRGKSTKDSDGAALTEAPNDDPAELPWQVIYIGDPGMIHRLKHHHKHHKRSINLALEGSGLAELPTPAADGLSDEQAPPEGHPGAVVPLAEEAFADAEFGTAGELYGAALATNTARGPSWYRTLLHLAKASSHRRNREFEMALAETELALEFFPCYTMGLLERAAIYLDRGEPDEALVPLEQILRLDREWHGLDRWLVRAHADVWRAANNNIDRYAETGIAGTSNHYTVLGLAIDFYPSELKKNYRRMSKLVHPDRREGGSDLAFQTVAEAYKTLDDDATKAGYDAGDDIPRERRRGGDEGPSHKETIHRKYFPERFGFAPFGDPFEQKKEQEQRKWETAPALANGANLPEGSYSGSCTGCQVQDNGTLLHCTHCKNQGNRRSDTTAKIPCDAGEWMGNIDGRLACEPVPKADDSAESKPEEGEEGLGGSSTGHSDDAADVPAPDPAAAAEGHGQKDEL